MSRGEEDEWTGKDRAPNSPKVLRVLLYIQVPSGFCRGASASASALAPFEPIPLPAAAAAAAAAGTRNSQSEKQGAMLQHSHH